MTINEIIAKIEKLNEWEEMIAEAHAEAEAIKDSLKSEMNNREIEELDVGQYIIRYASVLTQRFDTTSFKKQKPEMYKDFLKQSASRRFSIA